MVTEEQSSLQIANQTFNLFKKNKLMVISDVQALAAAIMYANGMAEVTAKKSWYETSSILNSRLNKITNQKPTQK